MKIAYLVSQYPAISHTFILEEISTLEGLGIEIEKASINQDRRPFDTLVEREKKERKKTFYIKSQGLIGFLKAFFFFFFTSLPTVFSLVKKSFVLGYRQSDYLRHLFYCIEAFILLHWMQRKKINHVHIHFANPAATVALIATAAKGYSYSLSIHGPDIFDNVLKNHLKEKIEQALFISCISYFAKSQLMRWVEYKYWQKMHVIPLGIDLNKFSFQKKKPKEPFKLLSVGRLVSAKGQHVLIDILKNLKQKGKKVVLEIVGDGQDRSSLEKRVLSLQLEEEIKFKGALNQDQVVQSYLDCDAFILTSFAEGVPVVLMEAMAIGRPVISSLINGIPELITDHESGRLISPSNVEQFVEAIEQLIEDSDLYERFAVNGRKKVELSYARDKNFLKLKQLMYKYLN